MPLGLIIGLGRAMRRKRTSSLDIILSSKRGPRDYYKGKNCKSTGFQTRKCPICRYVVMNEKLPNYVVPDLTNFNIWPLRTPRHVASKLVADIPLLIGQLKPYVAQCHSEAITTEATSQAS